MIMFNGKKELGGIMLENNQQFNQQFNQQPPQQQGGSGMAIASMVLGICSIVFSCIWYLTAILSIIGIVLAIVSLKQQKPGRGMAIAGLVTSIIGIILAIIFILLVAASIADLGSSYNFDF